MSVLKRLFSSKRTRSELAELRRTIQSFVEAETWTESKRIAEQHPELLSDEAIAVLAAMADQLRRDGEEETAEDLEDHVALLRRCRMEGVDAAFDPLLQSGVADEPGELWRTMRSFIEAETWTAAKRIVEQHPELLSDEAGPVLGALTKGFYLAGDYESAAVFENHVDILRQCRVEGVDTVFDRLLQATASDESDELAQTILSFVEAETWAESKRIVEQHPELLSDETETLLEEHMATARERGDDDVERMLEERREVLRHFRTKGIEAPFADRADPDAGELPEDLERVLRELAGPPRLSDMPRRVALCQQALRSVERRENPVLWGTLQAMLASSLAQSFQGDRAENLEQAIEHYSQALEVRTRQDDPDLWADTQSNLANAYAVRIRGDRAENLERAIEYYSQVLVVFTREAFPADWATTQNNLANTYGRRLLGDQEENLERAIEHYDQALEVRTRRHFPSEWAMLQNNLALAYADRVGGDPAENLEQAIEHYYQALEVRTRQKHPELWADTQHNLAVAYRLRIEGDRAENIERAIEHFRLALQVRTRQARPAAWAGTQSNLAVAFFDRARGDPVENLERAVEHFSQALEVYTRHAFPAEHLIIQRSLGNIHFGQGKWEPAFDCYRSAIETGDDLLAAAYTEAGRQGEVSETSRVYAQAAFSLFRLGRLGDALVQLEQGKARLLAEALALAEADLDQLPEARQEAVREKRQAVRDLETEMRLPPDTPARRSDRGLAELLAGARADLNQLIDEIRADHPAFWAPGLGLSDILALIPPGGALIAPAITSQGGVAFVLPHEMDTIGQEDALLLPELIDDAVQALLQGPAEDSALGGWLGAYTAFLEEGSGEATNDWRETLQTVTGQLWPVLMGPVHEQLQELGLAPDAPVILMPQGGLGLLPLHAAWRQVDGKQRTFLDDYTVTYAPSGYALDVARRRLKEPQRYGDSFLAVINPTGDLPFTPAEGEAVSRHFAGCEQCSLVGDQATQEAVVAGALGRSYLHFSCHGSYHWQDPMQSALLLAGDGGNGSTDPFELREILSPGFDLSAARLVTLSACETGLTEFRQSPDEYVGLPAGFLQAGAPAVVSSLWAVNDLSTTLLMGEFYRRHLAEGQEIATALRGAQLWLRDGSAEELKLADAYERLYQESGKRDPGAFKRTRYYRANPEVRPFAHPYYWAAFTFAGI